MGDGVKDPKYHFHFASDFKKSAMVSGKVGCDICNKNNPECVKKEENFFGSEHETGFDITGIDKDREIVEGDRVIMKCVASKFKYSNITWFKKEGGKNKK